QSGISVSMKKGFARGNRRSSGAPEPDACRIGLGWREGADFGLQRGTDDTDEPFDPAFVRDDRRAAHVVHVTQAELHVVPKGRGVHAAEIADVFQQPNLTVTCDRRFEVRCDLVELRARDLSVDGDLDKVRTRLLLVGDHPFRRSGPVSSEFQTASLASAISSMARPEATLQAFSSSQASGSPRSASSSRSLISSQLSRLSSRALPPIRTSAQTPRSFSPRRRTFICPPS